MAISKLVNIITPAYNSCDLLPKLLDSVLIQTYQAVKMFLVDDGSTDETRALVQRYVPRFEERGYRLEYIYQENAGQSAAMNNALKLVDGEYLVWIDADDYYTSPIAIEKLISALENTDDTVGIVRSRYVWIDENTGQSIRTVNYIYDKTPDYIIEDAIYRRNGFNYVPGGYAIKTKFLDAFIPNRNIYVEKPTGQNVQILLPYLALSKCLTIEDNLYNYVIRSDSHSRGEDYQKISAREEAHLRNFIATISNIPSLQEHKKKEYIHESYRYFLTLLLRLDYQHNCTREFVRHVKLCRRHHVALSKEQKRLALWTNVFRIKSYKRFDMIIKKCKKLL